MDKVRYEDFESNSDDEYRNEDSDAEEDDENTDDGWRPHSVSYTPRSETDTRARLPVLRCSRHGTTSSNPIVVSDDVSESNSIISPPTSLPVAIKMGRKQRDRPTRVAKRNSYQDRIIPTVDPNQNSGDSSGSIPRPSPPVIRKDLQTARKRGPETARRPQRARLTLASKAVRKTTPPILTREPNLALYETKGNSQAKLTQDSDHRSVKSSSSSSDTGKWVRKSPFIIKRALRGRANQKQILRRAAMRWLSTKRKHVPYERSSVI